MGTHKVIVVATTTEEEKHKTINTTGLKDPDLSWKAKGMHAYIRTNGDGWLQNQEGLVGASRDGRDAVRGGIKELVERKYLHKTTVRDEQGRIKYHAYISTPTPMDYSDDEIMALAQGQMVAPPQTGLPAPGNPLLVADSGSSLGTNEHYPLRGNINYTFCNESHYPSGNGASLPKPAGLGGQNAEELAQYWNSLPNTTTHLNKQPPTKVQALNAKALQRQLKYTPPKTIKAAMDVYNEFLGDAHTVLPMFKARLGKLQAPYKVPLHEFFEFTPYSIAVMDKYTQKTGKPHLLHGVKSWFIECKRGLNNLLEAFAPVRKAKYPELTTQVGDMWSEIVRYDGTATERNNIRYATERLVELHHQVKGQYANPINTKAAQHLIPWLGKYFGDKAGQGKQLHSGWLSSDITWRDFKNYLHEMGVLQDPRLVGRV